MNNTFIKEWICYICGFTAQFHNKSCPVVPVFECQHCDKSFQKLNSLKNHQICHSNYYIECVICTKKFKRKADLKEHSKVHENGMKSYECTICGNNLKRKKDLGH